MRQAPQGGCSSLASTKITYTPFMEKTLSTPVRREMYGWFNSLSTQLYVKRLMTIKAQGARERGRRGKKGRRRQKGKRKLKIS